MDCYSTHLPVLENILQIFQINKVFEFGCGVYSTLLFEKHCKKIIAIEMQSQEWYEKMKKQVAKNISLLYSPGPTGAIEIFDKTQDTFDLVFVDGHGESRWKCINHSFGKTKLIVTHDFETASYNWNLVKTPDNWKCFVYDKLSPHTAIYYHSDIENINKLLERLS